MIALDFLAFSILQAAGMLPVSLAPSHTLPQAPGQEAIVARYVIGDQTRELTRTMVSFHLAERHGNGSSGMEALEHLIETKLVEQAAKKAGLMPPPSEVRGRVQMIERTLSASGRDLEDLLAQSRMTRERFVETTALGMAQQSLAAATLGLSDPDKVLPKHLELWTKEQRSKVRVTIDPTQLPSGVVAIVGEDEVTVLDLGEVLFTKINPKGLELAVSEIIFRECVAYEAELNEITVKAKDLEEQFARRKRQFDQSGVSPGVGFEQWLEAFGKSKATELESAELLTIARHGKLVRMRYPDEHINSMLAEDRAALMRRHGARRNLHIIMLRATTNPNAIVNRDFAQALEQIEVLRAELLGGKHAFDRLAKINSEDPASKTEGGAIGKQHREYLSTSTDRRAPPEVLDEAFETPLGEVSSPIKTEEGYYLVWPSAEELPPEPSQLRARILKELAGVYNQELFEKASIEMLLK